MHDPIDRIIHTTIFITPVVESGRNGKMTSDRSAEEIRSYCYDLRVRLLEYWVRVVVKALICGF